MEPIIPTFKKKFTNLPPLALSETEKLTAPVKVPVFKKTYSAGPAPVPEKSVYDKVYDFLQLLKTEPRINKTKLSSWEQSLTGVKSDYDEGGETKIGFDNMVDDIKRALISLAKDAGRSNLIPVEFQTAGRKKTKRSKRSRRKTAKK